MNTLFRTITNSALPEDNAFASPSSSVVRKTSIIQINDLEISMLIGVLDTEKEEKQRVIVNIDAEVIPDEQWQKDDIDGVVSYVDIIERIQLIADSGHINLVETFVEKIIEACFSFAEIQSVNVSVQKPDILNNVASVGAEIYAERA